MAFFFASCSDIAQVEEQEPIINQQLEKSKLKQAALLITDLVKQPDVVKELKFAVDYSRTELGRDEDVYFSELFDQKASYKSKSTQSLSGTFAMAFRNAVNKAKAKGRTSDIEEDLEAYLKENNQ